MIYRNLSGRFLPLMMLFVLPPGAWAQSIELLERDAVIWLQEQTVTGRAAGSVSGGALFVNDNAYEFDVADGSFQVPIRVGGGETIIVACTADESVCSDTLRWELGYQLHPEPTLDAAVAGRTVTLHGGVLHNPTGTALKFRWDADVDNPAPTTISEADDSTAVVEIPTGAPSGEYYFDLVVEDADGSRGKARTFVTVDTTGVTPFDMERDHAAWVDDAVIFEITPYIFEEGGGLDNVLYRLEEIAELGVNTIWLQPVFSTHGRGQGYDITNYFEVRSDYGTEEDLREIVDRAHELGMKVLLDFVPNHTSSEHPYAQNAAEHGTRSHYYGFYLTEEDDAPYSRHYKRRPMGAVDFLIYFWDNLLIIDHDNPEVQRWMIEAGLHWIKEFDIDGYRIDAVWGTNARTPEMMQRWRNALKQYKPEVLLLGEDKATEPASFENRFDVAYDWYPGEAWVSRWTWQTDFSESRNPTFFNDASGTRRIELIRDALTNRGDGWHPDAKVLRFMENNDTFRFLEHHSVDVSRMAAAFLFSLPGIPLIYNGQEIGRTGHPYNSFQVYFGGRSIQEQSRFGLFEYYQQLIDIRSDVKALTSDTFAEVPTSASNIFAYHRWHQDEHIFGVMNPNGSPVAATLSLPVEMLGVTPNETYYLTDQITGDYFEVPGSELASVSIDMPATSTRILILADRVVNVGTDNDRVDELPAEITLAQNYPNPFNPATTIAFSLPEAGRARIRVFDMLGRGVKTVHDGVVPAGRHEVRFDGSDLASGVYVYRLEFSDRTVTKQMILLQ